MTSQHVVGYGVLVLFFTAPLLAACIARHYARSEAKRRAGCVAFFWMALPNYSIALALLGANFMTYYLP